MSLSLLKGAIVAMSCAMIPPARMTILLETEVARIGSILSPSRELPMVRLLYSGFRWSHHDELSGYHHVVPSQRDYVDGNKLPGGGSPFRSLANRLNLFLIDIATCIRGLRHDVVFMFYPEQTVYFSPLFLKWFKVKIVYAVHLKDDYWFQPGSSMSLRIKKWQMRFVDHFIVLSRDQLISWESRFPGKVSFIPHGAWCPQDGESPAQFRPWIGIVGDNYRDYDLMREVILHFDRACPEVVFHLIGVDKTKLQFPPDQRNVIVHGRLNTEAYRRKLSECSLIYLPLTFATANNALLEGLSSGTPVACNEVGGIRDYLFSDEYIANDGEELEAVYRRRAAMTEAEWSLEQKRMAEFCEMTVNWHSVHRRIEALAASLVESSNEDPVVARY
jgi:glycosyltransferase involved in cell wall biosynthesis